MSSARSPDSRCVAARNAALAAALLVPLMAASAPAQCSTFWRAGDGVPGIRGQVNATHLWDPDGAGPAPPQLVFGGSFAMAGDVLASRIVALDPATGA